MYVRLAGGRNILSRTKVFALLVCIFSLAFEVRPAAFDLDQPIPIPELRGDQYEAAIAFNGLHYLVVWTDGRDFPNRSEGVCIYAARINAAGELLDLGGIRLSSSLASQNSPAVAACGTNFLVVWIDQRDYSSPSRPYYDVYGTLISDAGTILTPNDIAIHRSPHEKAAPALASNGSKFLVAWEDYRSFEGSARDIYGTLVTPEGEVLDTNGIAICALEAEAVQPALAAFSDQFLVVWADGRNLDITGPDIYATRVSSAGNVLDPNGLRISSALSDQFNPRVTANNSGFLLAWTDGRDYETQYANIYGARVKAEGTLLDPGGIPICTNVSAQLRPALTATATNFVVVWEDDRNSVDLDQKVDVYMARLSSDGEVLDANGVLIGHSNVEGGPPGGLASVASNGRDYFVAWQSYRSAHGTTALDIDGVHVGHNATVDPGGAFVVSAVGQTEEQPAVAFNGNEYLVVWNDHRNSPVPTSQDIFGVRLNRWGQVLDAVPIAICTATNRQFSAAVAAAGRGFLVTWVDTRHDPLGLSADIYGARVNDAGVVFDSQGIPICTAPQTQDGCSVSSDGTNFLVAWTDGRNATTAPDIYGSRVDATGQVLDLAGIALCRTNNFQGNPRLAFNGTNYLAVWTDIRNESTTDSDIYAARVSPSGVSLDTNGFSVCAAVGAQKFSAIASDGVDFFVVWQDSRNLSSTGLDIYGARVNNNGQVADPMAIAVCLEEQVQSRPALEFGGRDYFVVWEDYRDGGDAVPDIYGTRVSKSGMVTSSGGLSLYDPALITSSLPSLEFIPAIASSGHSQYLAIHEALRFGVKRVLATTAEFGPKIQSIARISEGIELRWAAESNQTYRVQFKAMLPGGPWADLPGDVTATNSIAGAIDGTWSESGQRFYQVIELSPD